MTNVQIQAGAVYDLPSNEEMNKHFARVEARFSELTREALRGMKIERFPTLSALAAGASLVLPATSSGYGLIGPESGYIWQVNRLTVASNGADSATSNPAVTTPATPATGVAAQNPNPFAIKVVIGANGSTITAVTVNGTQVGTAAGTYTVPAGGTISIAYTVATPTMVWSALGATMPGAAVSLYTTSDETQQQGKLISTNLQVGVPFIPGGDGMYLMPGEGVSAVIASTPGNVYTLTGQVWSCPAEMMGKLH